MITPKVEKEEQDVSLFPVESIIPLSEVLSTVDLACNFLEYFEHLQPLYRKSRPDKSLFFANGGEMIYLTRTEQQIADACKNLIKNAIICWNYLYLTRKVQQSKNAAHVEELIKAAKQKTVNAWQHIYFTGKYDFSDENMTDSFDLLRSQNYDLIFN